MKPWKITLGDDVWTDEDATAAHVVAVAELVGDGWDAVSPWSGPRSLAAWLVVLRAGRTADLDAAMAEVYALPASALAACIDEK